MTATVRVDLDSRTSTDGPLLPADAEQQIATFIDQVPTLLKDILALEPPPNTRITVHIVDDEGISIVAATNTSPDKMHFQISSRHLRTYALDGRIKEAEGIILHQVATVLTGSFDAPKWVITGATDYARIRTNRPNVYWGNWGRYTHGWCVAASFFVWIEETWSISIVKDLLRQHSETGVRDLILERTGAQVDALWSEYTLPSEPEVQQEEEYIPVPSGPFMSMRDEGGSLLFWEALPEPLEYLAEAYDICTSLLYPSSEFPPKRVPRIKLILSPTLDGVASTSSYTITFGMGHVQRFGASHSLEELKKEIQGILVHEMVHVVQYNKLDSAPGGLIEGIADYCRLHADLAPEHWRLGAGGKWDDGYQVTAYFLDWIEQNQFPQFVAGCNSALEQPYTPEWCRAQTEKSWEELWELFQATLAPTRTGIEVVPTHAV